MKKSNRFVSKFSRCVNGRAVLCLSYSFNLFKQMSLHNMKLRSAMTEEDKERMKAEEQNEMNKKSEDPVFKFPDEIQHIVKFEDCVAMCNDLCTLANHAPRPLTIGASIEWPLNSPKDELEKFCLVQLCYNLLFCSVIKIDNVNNLGKPLNELFIHPNVELTGVNIKLAIRRLNKEFPYFDDETIVKKCVDCGSLAKRLLPRILPIRHRWSMEKLVEHMYKMKYDKEAKEALSQWYGSSWQDYYFRYSAVDPYASLAIYFEFVVKLMNEQEKYESQQ